MNRICAVCGAQAPSLAQWFNRDTGYSVCSTCFLMVAAKDGIEQAISYYGLPGKHHSLDVTPLASIVRQIACTDEDCGLQSVYELFPDGSHRRMLNACWHTKALPNLAAVRLEFHRENIAIVESMLLSDGRSSVGQRQGQKHTSVVRPSRNP